MSARRMQHTAHKKEWPYNQHPKPHQGCRASYPSHNTGTVCLCKRHYNAAVSEVRFAEKQAAEVAEATVTPAIAAATASAGHCICGIGDRRPGPAATGAFSACTAAPLPSCDPAAACAQPPREAAVSAACAQRHLGEAVRPHRAAPELVRMLQEKAAELKALQRSNQDLHAAMVRRRTKQRIQQRAQRGLILQQQQQQQQLQHTHVLDRETSSLGLGCMPIANSIG